MTEKIYYTGAKRDDEVDEFRFDLIPAEPLKRLARIYATGAKQYGERNWEKGMPNNETINHLFGHLIAYQNGDRSEDHLAKVAWNAFALMFFENPYIRITVNDLGYKEVDGYPGCYAKETDNNDFPGDTLYGPPRNSGDTRR